MSKKRQAWLQETIRRDPISGHAMRRAVSPELSQALSITGTADEDNAYDFPEITREQLFDLMRITNPHTVLALICGSNIRSSDEAAAFLLEHGGQDEIFDYHADVDEAISRKADLSLLLDIVNEKKVSLWRYNMECSFVDLAELYGSSLRDMEIDYILADGGNTWNFIKRVGITNIRQYGDELLHLEGTFSGQQIKSMISRANGDVDITKHSGSLKLSKREKLGIIVKASWVIGTEEAIALRYPRVVMNTAKLIREGGLTDAASLRFLDDYFHITGTANQTRGVYQTACRFHDNGFSAEEAAAFIEEDISLERALGIRDSGTPTAVSSGWL